MELISAINLTTRLVGLIVKIYKENEPYNKVL